MNRLQYWIKAKTQYNLHSPFVFALYNEVLFARVGVAERKQAGSDDCYVLMVYKLRRHFGLTVLAHDASTTLLQGDDIFGQVLVVNRPHRTPQNEAAWERLKADGRYRVDIDIFDVGLLFSNPRLHRQSFLLR